MAKNYETKISYNEETTQRTDEKDTMLDDQAERATVDVQEDAADLVARLPLSEAYEVIDRLKALSAAQISRPEYKHIRTSLHPFVVERISESYSSISSQITCALRDEREVDALGDC